MEQYPISRAHLKAMLKHVKYEIQEYRDAFRRWRKFDPEDPEWNPAVERALLHFRVLREFFLLRPDTIPQPHRADSVLAAYYTDKWEPSVEPVLFETKADIDKRLAHLTTRRLNDTVWRIGEMERAMESLISQFISALELSDQLEFYPPWRWLKSPTGNDVANGTQTIVEKLWPFEDY